MTMIGHQVKEGEITKTIYGLVSLFIIYVLA